jgi:hypothetical protein
VRHAGAGQVQQRRRQRLQAAQQREADQHQAAPDQQRDQAEAGLGDRVVGRLLVGGQRDLAANSAGTCARWRSTWRMWRLASQ